MHTDEDAAASRMARRFAAAGIVVPYDRAAGACADAQGLLDAVYWLRRPREAAAEPGHVFVAGPPRS